MQPMTFLASLLAAAALWTAPAPDIFGPGGDDPPPPPRHGHGRHHDGPREEACSGPGPETQPGGRSERHHGRHWLRWLFRPAPEDFGPLRPGEEEELREFARTELPQLSEVLDRVEQQQPGELQRSFRHCPKRADSKCRLAVTSSF